MGQTTVAEDDTYRVTEDVARGETVLLFDYQNRNPLNYEARVVEVCEMEEETVF